ncbi:A/G-specific DNA-adenine glycosylase [Singulisphaera sp. GP187]|uniref:A/G-specific adenine glycosylase n=1 Tax=Singulisphaera sp. GP187 TaxID=1882752 RepID=UPI00092C8CD4|nr:A/G-specific adenine glycosylase [Singulisphaera sp. GP187]SIO58689.1 A/G-specific DNA-adenine glycosylase [Singulisphaera sp. GP187]
MGRTRKLKFETTVPDAPQATASPDLDPVWVARIRERLVAWYAEAQRPLPWRADRDPYRVLVSEMMLVQTTVTAVIPYFERFLNQFPTIEALAAADETEVLKAWEGLGYYRRARQLHAAARAVVTEHGGAFPTTPEAIRALPGVGRYIAGAIQSFAFDQPAPIVEANTQRVLARWLAWREDLKSSRTQARLWETAERLVPPEGAGVFNQAFMELGALLCTPRSPSCLVCPVAAECGARVLGIQDQVPTTTPKPPPLEVAEACGLIARGGRVLIVQRGPGRLWEHFWEFPTIHLTGVDPAGRSFADAVDLAEGIQRLTGVRVRMGPVVQTVRFSVTKHRVQLDASTGVGLSETLKPGPGLVRAIWEKPENLPSYPFGAASRRLVAWVAKHEAKFPDFESDD